jgi:glycosyltransferase involved in cell wall biosynthesis
MQHLDGHDKPFHGFGTPMRLAILVPDLQAGGAQKSMILLAEGLRRLGLDAELLVMRPTGLFAARAEAAVGMRVMGGGRARHSLPALLAYAHERRPDIVVSALPQAVLAAEAARLAGARFRHVATAHGFPDVELAMAAAGLQRAIVHLARLSLKRADRIVAVSHALAADLAGRDPGLTPRLAVAPNAVIDEADLLAGVRARDPQARRTVPLIAYIGRLSPEKGLDALLGGFAAWPRGVCGRLVVAGDGPARPPLEARARTLGIADRVAFLGFQENVRDLIDGADLVALPSPREAFGNVLIEGLARGVPALALAGSGGPEEIVAYGRYGVLATNATPEAIATALEAAVVREWATQDLVAQARSHTVAAAALTFKSLLSD